MLRTALATGFAGVILAIEATSPPALSVGCFYIILAAYSALRLSESRMMTLLVVTVLAGLAIKHGQLPATVPATWTTISVQAWNGASRLATTCIFGIVLHRLMLTLRRERARAEHDPLTGALNRRALIERLPALAVSTARSREAVGIAYVDLDGFKPVNDRHGHAVGDELLCRFALGATATLGQRDLFARVGGDEFVAVLPGRDPATIEAHAVALQARLATALGELDLGVTCSMAVIITEVEEGLALAPLIEDADRLMYQVKRAGKNALRITHDLPGDRYRGAGRIGGRRSTDPSIRMAASAR